MAESCETCAYRYKLEKLDYSQGGCKHEDMPGYICMALQDEGIASWVYGLEGKGKCEAYSHEEGCETMTDRETVIMHLQVMHTWATFALEEDIEFFDEVHIKDIADWTMEALNLIEGRTESMYCPKCGEEGYHKVMQTYPLPDMIRRRRKCLKCGKTFYTEERTVEK